MDLRQTHQLLIRASAIDNRVVSGPAGEAAVTMWHELLGHMDFLQLRDALDEHRRASTEYVTPAHLVAIINARKPSLPLPPRAGEGMCRIHDEYPLEADGRCYACREHPEDLQPGAPRPTLVPITHTALSVGRDVEQAG